VKVGNEIYETTVFKFLKTVKAAKEFLRFFYKSMKINNNHEF